MVVRGIDNIWLFFQVVSKKYCRSVEVPRLNETRFSCFFDDWVLLLGYFFFKFFTEFAVLYVDNSLGLIQFFQIKFTEKVLKLSNFVLLG